MKTPAKNRIRLQVLAAIAIAAPLLTTGCSPIVYKQVEGADRSGLIKFNLQASAVLIEKADEKEGAVSAWKVTSVPTSSGNRYAIEPQVYFIGYKAHLNVTKYENTEVIKRLTIDTEDGRKEFLLDAIPVMAAVASLGVVAGPPSSYVINTEPLLKDANSKDEFTRYCEPHQQLGHNCNFVAATDKSGPLISHITFGALTKDSFSRNEGDFDNNRSDVYMFSACRTATIHFTDKKIGRVTVMVADPNFLQTIKIPEKGSVVMHSACGADTTSEKSSVVSNTSLLNEAISTVKSVLESEQVGK